MAGKVRIEIIHQKGVCAFCHEKGQTWETTGTTPEGLCGFAFATLYPGIFAMLWGARFPWASEDGSILIHCPDADNPVIFKLTPVEMEV